LAIESGKEYNPDTARDLRPRTFHLEGCGESFRYTLQVPEYILRRLDSAMTDRLQEYMTGYIGRKVTEALQGGYMFSDSGRAVLRADVGLHLKNYLWERFSISQEEEGNGCFQVAPSLQRVHA
jgi:hypothetical protein